MNTELKQLIEDAAKLLGLDGQTINGYTVFPMPGNRKSISIKLFNPIDPERGDLRKVMEAAELVIDFEMHSNAVGKPTPD